MSAVASYNAETRDSDSICNKHFFVGVTSFCVSVQSEILFVFDPVNEVNELHHRLSSIAQYVVNTPFTQYGILGVKLWPGLTMELAILLCGYIDFGEL